MRKIIFASHHKLAEGLRDTFDYITNNVVEVKTINAYISNNPVEEEIVATLKDLDLQKDEVLVFTDMQGGSVNQAFVKYLQYPHFHLIAGVNLPLILELLINLPENYIDSNQITAAIDNAKKQIIYVNDVMNNLQIDEDDE
ncbi:PTS N-acetylglucosamine transporter subunit IIBC [Lactobacillus sp. ESL0679]|uniref:PTS sugar transporter subunit IIA n=1 Tax=Lactobacillus sp. ESL0679 TaxID=2983209 RepID=UPI0023F91C09|nr:PTS N-acetylglucosamine transporter subunit IIBC [Lactobacillus sp. ESL0679]MDF7681992.1 PTS N-acetylglucosamine transporter subunit IIBC [Lactobacillus sp. ESL0679]